MRLSRRHWFALLCLWPLACNSTTNSPPAKVTDGSTAIDRPALTDRAVLTDRAALADRAVLADRPVLADRSARTDLGAEASSLQCNWSSLPKSADGAAACVGSRGFVTCTDQRGSSSYPSADPATSCLSCEGTCADLCTESEFSLSCGAPLPSGSTNGCRLAFTFLSGAVDYCCPCQ